jgi:signal transduction histidine kinase
MIPPLFRRVPLPRSRKAKLLLLVGGVAAPALILAAVASQLTLRVADEVEIQTRRYNAYLAEKVGEAFQAELLDRIRDRTLAAENIARQGASPEAIVRALATQSRDFEAPLFVPMDQMDDFLLVTVEGQLLFHGTDPTGRRQHPFAAVLIRGADGEPIGAGGWWFNPRAFAVQHLEAVMQDRLPRTPGLFGGLESMRHLGARVLDNRGNEVSRIRELSHQTTAERAPMRGPFEGYVVEVASTAGSPAALAGRFVTVEMGLILVLTLAVLGATAVGVRYTIRQMELVQIKSSFVSNVTHELKTPIAVIKLAVETLELGRFRSDEERDKYLRTILRESDRLTRLVDNILDYSRLESGQRTLRLRAVLLHELVASVMESFRLRLEDEGFEWSVEVPEDLPPVRAEPIALQHCLLNLLDNAVKYSRDHRIVKVHASAGEGMVSLAVSDRGIGIGKDDHQRIFEKFARVETGLVHDVKGAGLGLSLVDQIIRAHHGRIEVVSTLGEGSTFTLWLPRWEEHRSGRPARNA